MLRSLSALGLVAGAMLVLVPVVHADQTAHGPVHTPRVNGNYHVSFTLPGRSWRQVTGLSEGTPSLGSFRVQLADYSHVALYVRARLQASRPERRGNSVRLAKGARLRVDRQGSNGPVRWWSGTRTDGIVAATGYQRAPARLDPSRKRWIVYTVMQDVDQGRDDGDSFEVTAVRTAARTMRLAWGPVETPDVPPTID
ncbi:hypothetical protein OJ998_20610 [Solirubrobacter taibaiensis]|nr:hypothetical protein [Solirubrobacter taibaiensis]